ncbi:MAG: hypothetical protein ABIP75_05255 [Pyrinomonadaceae bacterium]
MNLFLLTIFSCLALSANSVLCQAPSPKIDRFDDWLRYASSADGFNVKFPSTPAIDQVPVGANTSNASMDMFTYDGLGGRHLQVSVINFTKGLTSAVAAKEGGLTAMINSLVGDGGKLISRQEITRGNCSGIEAILQMPHVTTRVPSLVKARTFSSGDRVYLILYGGAADTPQEKMVADQFLDSFAVVGGCVESAAANGVRPSTTAAVSGQPVPGTGWQRYAPPYGINFLFPGGAELMTEQLAGAKSPIPHYTYAYGGQGHVFSVEIFDGYDPEFRNSPGLLDAAMDGIIAATRKTMEAAGIKIGEGKPLQLGAIRGREFQLSFDNGAPKGRMQVFVTKTRTYAITALRIDESADQEIVRRFFAAVAIQ